MTRNEAILWQTISAIHKAITEAGEAGLPSGHLYATLCGMISLETYQGILAILIKSGKITEQNHLLRAKEA